MLDLIIEGLPELEKLEGTVTDLERKYAQAQARVQALAHKSAQARENDLNLEAAALNAGRKSPNPTEPALREQSERAAATRKFWRGDWRWPWPTVAAISPIITRPSSAC